MRSGRVLVVEDDEAIRLLVRTVLDERGYDVTEVGDGLAAVPAAREHAPDVVLLDVGLPGLDGFGVLAELKADPHRREVPVVMVTAWAEPDLIAKALDRGAHDYVRKPFDIAELAARVDAAFRVKARQDALNSDNERLSAIATVDALTGLANRAHVQGELERELAAAGRAGRPVSVVLFDLDHFKAVNDTHGHNIGDEVLQAAARRLEKRLRRSDVLGRWGGEEFLVVAPDTELEGAADLAEALRTVLAERPLDVPGTTIRATASLGAAQWDGHETLEHLVERCDQALYAAKADGRDAVRVARPRLHAVA